MSPSKAYELERLLGIFSPWSIKSVGLDDASRALTIRLAFRSGTHNLFSAIIDPIQEKTTDLCFWHHLSLGNRFQTYIVARRSDVVDFYRDAPSTKPDFLGAIDKSYSHGLAQSANRLISCGVDVTTMASVLGVDKKTITTIKSDVESTAALAASDLHLVPAQNDPVWQKILDRKLRLDTLSVPLRLLVSKLCAETTGAESSSGAHEKSITDLRSFFIKNASKLPRELEQLSGPLQAKKQPRKLSLVLAGESNPIWIDIVRGDFDLASKNLSLNLLLTRLGQQYKKNSDLSGVLSARLRDYFKQNQRQLLPELKLMTAAIRSNKYSAAKVSIPAIGHPIWVRMIKDKMLVPKSLNFKLLLANIRASLGKHPSEEALESSAGRLKAFVESNRISLKQEFSKERSVAA